MRDEWKGNKKGNGEEWKDGKGLEKNGRTAWCGDYNIHPLEVDIRYVGASDIHL